MKICGGICLVILQPFNIHPTLEHRPNKLNKYIKCSTLSPFTLIFIVILDLEQVQVLIGH